MEMLWRALLPLQPSVTINAFTSSPPPHLEEGTQMEEKLGYNLALQCLQDFNQARAQLKSMQSKEAQKLDHMYNARQIKMKRRHEQEWVRMAWEGDYIFQEVFSMTGLAESVNLLPWCISTGVPLCHMDDALAAAEQQGNTTQATGVQLSQRNHLLWDFQAILIALSNSSSYHTSSTGSSFGGHPFFESLAGPSWKKRDHSPSRPFGNCHGKRTQVNSPWWRL